MHACKIFWILTSGGSIRVEHFFPGWSIRWSIFFQGGALGGAFFLGGNIFFSDGSIRWSPEKKMLLYNSQTLAFFGDK